MKSLDAILEVCPEPRIRLTRDFRIDSERPIELATEKPERAEKLEAHAKRIRRCLRALTIA